MIKYFLLFFFLFNASFEIGFCFEHNNKLKKEKKDISRINALSKNLINKKEKKLKNNNHKKSEIHCINKNEILIDKVKALIFTNNPILQNEKNYKNIEGIQIDGVYVQNEKKFKKQFLCFLNRPLTLNILDQIKQRTLLYFQNNVPYLMDVKILENQDVSKGNIQILVLFAKLNEITSTGGRYFSNERILQKLNMKLDEWIDLKEIKRYLTLFNQNPFRNVSMVLEPSKGLGYTNIHFITEDIFPLKIFAGYENTGNQIASQNRFFTGLNFGNFLNLDHQMNIEFKCAPNVDKWWGITGNYIMPTFYSNYVKVIGSYVKTKPDTENKYYRITGKAWTVMARYHIPLPLYINGVNEVIIGYDFKHTNNFLEFLASSVFDNFIDVSQFVFQLSGSIYDRLGFTSYLATLYVSPGDMTKHNENIDFKQEGNAKDASYFYLTFHFDRTFNISKDFLYVLDFFAQVSNRRLLPTEEISIGGFYTVRGYQENAVYGDKGFYMRNEIRTPQIKFYKYKNLKHDFQMLAFSDLGYVSRLNENLSVKDSSFLASFGPGLRYTVEDYLRVKLDYGVQLKKANRDFFAKSWHSRLHAYISFQY